ncbi:MAG: hypothetical protein ACI8TA_002597 [Cyclobacteriaceae bacterium]|jgi:hypothetical protein
MKIMKNTTNNFTKIIIGLFITTFVISCNTQQGQKENEHNDMMEDGHTEIMEGDDHMGDDEQQIMEDTTMMETNEEMMY